MSILPVNLQPRGRILFVHTPADKNLRSESLLVTAVAPPGEPEITAPIFWYYPGWLPLFLIGMLGALVVLVIRYRTAYLMKKHEEMRLHRQTHFQSQMLAVINHDIQTPLHYLERSLAQIDAYIRQQSDDKVIRDTTDVAYHAVRQIRKFTGDLLLFVKMQMREQHEEIAFEPVNINEVIEVTLEFFSPTIQSKALTVRNKVPGELILTTNKNLFSVILHNLIDNALKNTVEGEISISSHNTDTTIDILVTDTGSGLSRETAEWINAAVVTQDHYSEPGASGLGMVIVKEFCALLHARLHVSANSPRGTVVKLSFPV